MKFIIELVAATYDDKGYNLAGRVTGAGDDEGIAEYTAIVQEELDKLDGLEDNIRVVDNEVLFSNLPMPTLSVMMGIWNKCPQFNIETVLSPEAKYLPEDCKPMFKMTLPRYFND